MRTNGWYAALAIVMNYVLALTLTPGLVVIGHLRYERYQGQRTPSGCCPPRCKKRTYNPDMQGQGGLNNGDEVKKLGGVERFLRNVYLPIMSKTMNEGSKLRPVALFCTIVMFGVGIQGVYFSSQLQPPDKPEQWFPSNHVLYNFGPFMTDNFMIADEDNFVTLTMFWGIDGIDRGPDFNEFTPAENNKGAKAIFATDFDLSTAACQAEILFHLFGVSQGEM